ncbi:MAG: SRPBCC domain-containing protein [Polyangiaceae bacterium]|nr:SRPBCC domain-containing protein [Polyangiaceae bacterium]
MFGAEFRRVEDREHLGQEVIVSVATRTYATDIEDLWQAITTKERLARWFAVVDGDFRLGGQYQITGNASGTITRCEPPRRLELTWEIMGGTSWVHVTLGQAGAHATLQLEHLATKAGIGEEHLKKFGPGAVGIGWDLWLHGLGLHMTDPEWSMSPAEGEAWLLSPEGKDFVRGSGAAWGVADEAAGEDPETAKAKTARTIAFYTGE